MSKKNRYYQKSKLSPEELARTRKENRRVKRHKKQIDHTNKSNLESKKEVLLKKKKNRHNKSTKHAVHRRKLLLQLQRHIIPKHQEITKQNWEALVKEWGNACAYCRNKSSDLTVDHVIPLSKGGLNSMDNVLPACITCNVERKRDFTMLEWLGFDAIHKMHPLGFVYIAGFCLIKPEEK